MADCPSPDRNGILFCFFADYICYGPEITEKQKRYSG